MRHTTECFHCFLPLKLSIVQVNFIFLLTDTSVNTEVCLSFHTANSVSYRFSSFPDRYNAHRAAISRIKRSKYIRQYHVTVKFLVFRSKILNSHMYHRLLTAYSDFHLLNIGFLL